MSCTRCGWCCRHLVVFYPSELARDDFMLERGWKVLQESHHDGVNYIQWVIEHPCPHLVTFDGMSGCAIYDRRPEACVTYPGGLNWEALSMEPLVGLGPLCGYRRQYEGGEEQAEDVERGSPEVQESEGP